MATAALLMLSSACKKKAGSMSYKGRFTTAETLPPGPTGPDSVHTVFGAFIGSITPQKLSCKVGMFIFQDHYNQHDPSCHMIAYIENQQMDVDFSGNAEIVFNPVLHSTDIMDGLFKQKEVDFRFISFMPSYFYHEFQLPLQYKYLLQNRPGNQFLSGADIVYDSVQNTILVKIQKDLSYGAIHGKQNGMPTGFGLVFGQTDSSYVYQYKGVELNEADKFPFWNSQMMLIRSHQFKTQKIVMPDEGQTNTMYSTLAFMSDDLIHLYAGNDGMAYTADDVLVYAPRFWNRFNLKLESFNQ